MPKTSSKQSKGKNKVGEGSSTTSEPLANPHDPLALPRSSNPKQELIFNGLLNRVVIKERSFAPSAQTAVKARIEFHKLDYFCGPLEPIRLPWIQEFYGAGAYLSITDKASWKAHTIEVRDHRVNFDTIALTTCFGMTIPQICGCLDLYKLDGTYTVSLDEVLSVIAIKGSTWSEGDSYLPRRILLPEAAFWLNFIRFNLLPSSNRSELNKDRALLIFTIMTERPINFVGLIHQTFLGHIKRFGLEFLPLVDPAQAKRKRGESTNPKKIPFIFPSLITALCSTCGVRPLRSETTDPAATPLPFSDTPASAHPSRARPVQSTGSRHTTSTDVETLRRLQLPFSNLVGANIHSTLFYSQAPPASILQSRGRKYSFNPFLFPGEKLGRKDKHVICKYAEIGVKCTEIRVKCAETGQRNLLEGRDSSMVLRSYSCQITMTFKVLTIEGICTIHTFKNYTKLEHVGPEDYYCRFEYKPASGAFLPDRVAVYCKREMPYNLDDLMIQCDECKDWFQMHQTLIDHIFTDSMILQILPLLKYR
ncbi:hypothetical protein BUALT_Bualt18G0036200 [Buddleja alternifolia]|uniref:Putative plant transposon protein domain-containing protein n=1 Tax=Buddleja alternifolia TaxID=168488 RepID=A0AAV6W342_9LAMI|nr:hypothetical protein BUALT_Bualt18G0036200 [Buddleja alternifolia]